MLTYLYEKIYENEQNCVEVRELFEIYKEFTGIKFVDIDLNVLQSRTKLEKHMSDDLEIMKCGRVLNVGWAKEMNETVVSAMKSDKITFVQKMRDVYIYS